MPRKYNEQKEQSYMSDDPSSTNELVVRAVKGRRWEVFVRPGEFDATKVICSNPGPEMRGDL